jgi:hypothetical protein
MSYAIETAILFSIGTPAAFIAGGFPIRQAFIAGLLALVMLALFYLASFIGCCL